MKKIICICCVAAVSAICIGAMELGSVTVGNRETPVLAGYKPIYIQAVSGTQSGIVTVYHVTMTPVTNTLGNVSLSGGKGSISAPNMTFKNGDYVFATGNPLTNGNAQIVVTK